MQDKFLARIAAFETVSRHGRVRKISPTMIEADGPNVPIGGLCSIETVQGRPITCEVVSVEQQMIRLVPYEPVTAIAVGNRLTALAKDADVPVGDALLGCAVNALGRDLVSGAQIGSVERSPAGFVRTSPLSRETRVEQLVTGIKAIDGMLPLSIGQRVGIFAASGVGKTSLVQQLLHQVQADRCVLCLVGERGREVEAVWTQDMAQSTKSRTVLVAATSDETAVMRVRAVHHALALARHWRDQGHHVAFFLDSISRYAMAQREIGLAAGEPPTARGYTPNVFAALPMLVEQCGALHAGGSISGFFTVLGEDDDNDDPICEVMKSLLDGHIVLSRKFAEQGHFPAIDVERSVSRLLSVVTHPEQRRMIERARACLATYSEAKMLIDSGLYAKGSASHIDHAMAMRDPLAEFLQQSQTEAVGVAQTRQALANCFREAV